MRKRPFDLPKYFFDFLRYKGLNQRMFWFQKFKRRRWVYGQNFGDYLSFVIVGELLNRSKAFPLRVRKAEQKLLALGSVMHFANTGDVVWGTGVNGKMPLDRHKFDDLDVRMVRGPLTRDFLKDQGVSVPGDVYGDPAILLPYLFPKLKAKPVSGKVIVLPNFNELDQIRPLISSGFNLVSPVGYWRDIVKQILSSELVLTSSLHGLIIAEVFNVPVRFVAPCGGETLFKYDDYLQGTGRQMKVQPQSFLQGIHQDMGVTFSPPIINVEGMIGKFPLDFFS